MRVLDLFSGVGMMAYGMEKAGHEVVAFCEIEEFPRRVLRKHWPDVPIFEDVRELNYEALKEAGVVADTKIKSIGARLCTDEQSGQRRGRSCHSCGAGGARQAKARVVADTDSGNGNGRQCEQERKTQGRTAADRDGEIWRGAGIEIITGGFPCQDLSVAGKQAGITGSRSGLFDEIVRLACELRPRYILLENVATLLTGANGDWAGYVFGRLADLRYDCEWHVIPAGGFETLSAGAPHLRERVWIVAHRQREGLEGHAGNGEGRSEPGRQHSEAQRPVSPEGLHGGPGGTGSGFIEPRLGNGPDGPAAGMVGHRIAANLADIPVCDACGEIHNLPTMGHTGPCWMCWGNGSWEHGIPRITIQTKHRAKKLKALGNGLLWSIPYAIGRALK